MPKPVRPDSTPVLRLEPEKRICPLFDPTSIPLVLRRNPHWYRTISARSTSNDELARGTPILRDAARRSFYF